MTIKLNEINGEITRVGGETVTHIHLVDGHWMASQIGIVSQRLATADEVFADAKTQRSAGDLISTSDFNAIAKAKLADPKLDKIGEAITALATHSAALLEALKAVKK